MARPLAHWLPVFPAAAADSGPPRERKKLQLKPRSVPAGEEQKQPEAAAAPPQQQQAPSQQSAPKPSAAAIFGGARPVDTAAREREIEARLARQREEEERKMVRDRDPPFQDRYSYCSPLPLMLVVGTDPSLPLSDDAGETTG